MNLGEIKRYLPGLKHNSGDVEGLLEILLREKIIHQIGSFYSLQDNVGLIQERTESEIRAKKYMEKAIKNAQLIASFPYVEAVFISGSLSKGVIRADGDIDYFIITAPNRLWVCRSLLILYKKIFLFNSHKYFCLNYFIDSQHLEIEDKNIFTATEIASLIPLKGNGIVKAFFDANQWVFSFLPNISFPESGHAQKVESNFLRRGVESILGNKLGDFLDKKSLGMTLTYWSKKFQNFDKQAFMLAFKSKSYISKHHPGNFQEKVLMRFSNNYLKVIDQLKQSTYAAK